METVVGNVEAVSVTKIDEVTFLHSFFHYFFSLNFYFVAFQVSVPIWQCFVLVDAHMRVKRIFYEEGEEEGSKHDDEMGQEDVLAEGEDQHLQHQLDKTALLSKGP